MARWGVIVGRKIGTRKTDQYFGTWCVDGNYPNMIALFNTRAKARAEAKDRCKFAIYHYHAKKYDDGAIMS